MDLINQETISPTRASTLDWEKLNREWKESGLSQRAFCQARGLNLSTFTYHRGKRLENQRASKSHHFAQVNVKMDPSLSPYQNLMIHFPNSIRLSIPPGVSSAQIKIVLSALGLSAC